MEKEKGMGMESKRNNVCAGYLAADWNWQADDKNKDVGLRSSNRL